MDKLKRDFPSFTEFIDDLSKNSTQLIGKELKKFIALLKANFEASKAKMVSVLENKEITWNQFHDKKYSSAKKNEIAFWPMWLQLTSGLLCLSFSAAFHLYFVHSPVVSAVLARLDYGGIALLGAGSCAPPYYYFFYCNTEFVTSYITLIWTLAICIFTMTMMERFAHSSYRPIRGFVFMCFGATGIVPFFHYYLLGDSLVGLLDFELMVPYFVGCGFYVFGALLYMSRLPERRWPGKFDHVGNSHNIFHLCVLAALCMHYQAGIVLYRTRIEHSCDI